MRFAIRSQQMIETTELEQLWSRKLRTSSITSYRVPD
jgi:hypothetical protein